MKNEITIFIESHKDKTLGLLVSKITIQKFISIQIDITNYCNFAFSNCYHPHHKNDEAISIND